MVQLEPREPQGQKEAQVLQESEPQAQQEFKVQRDLLVRLVQLASERLARQGQLALERRGQQEPLAPLGIMERLVQLAHKGQQV
jgi:hypothetical protein